MKQYRVRISNDDHMGDFQHPACMIVELVNETGEAVQDLTKLGIVHWPLFFTITEKGAVLRMIISGAKEDALVKDGIHEFEVESIKLDNVKE